MEILAVMQNWETVIFIPKLSREIKDIVSRSGGREANYYLSNYDRLGYVDARSLFELKKNSYDLSKVSQPTERAFLEAVRHGPDALQNINNPSEAVQILAVTFKPDAIRFVRNQSEAVQLAATTIKFDEKEKIGRALNVLRALRYIKNPSERVENEIVSTLGILNRACTAQELLEIYRNLEGYSLPIRKAVLSVEPSVIRYIAEPGEEVQLAAVMARGDVIQFIPNPSEAFKLAAITQDGTAIVFIEDPSEGLKLAAATQSGGRALSCIDNPSEQIILAAIRRDPFAISQIAKPTKAMQLAAVRGNGLALRLIREQEDDIKTEAVKQNPHAIQYAEPAKAEPIFGVQRDVVTSPIVSAWGGPISRVEETDVEIGRTSTHERDEALHMLAVEKDCTAIQHIKSPSNAVQLAAVKKDPQAIAHIKNPADEVQLLVGRISPLDLQGVTNRTTEANKLYNKAIEAIHARNIAAEERRHREVLARRAAAKKRELDKPASDGISF